MLTAYITNILACLATGVVGFLIYYRLKGAKKENHTLYYYGLTWLFLGTAIFLLGVSTIADWRGNLELQKKIFHLIEIISFAAVFPASLAVFSMFKSYKINIPSLVTKIYFYTMSGLFAVFLFGLFTFGLAYKETIFFGVTLSLNQLARIVMAVSLLIPLLMATCLLFYRIFNKKMTPLNGREKMLIAGLYIFAIAAGFAQSGLFQGWQIIFARIFLLIGALVAFLALHDLKNKLVLLK